ncbi:MAG: AMP-binding protein, partial [Leptospiraceae bacterium]|nr:AMP-binding protein [Leptospiraceae bacterium]
LFSLRKRFLPVKLPQYKKLGDGCIRYKEILSRFSTKMRHSCEQLKSEDLAVLIYTGGTTGVSKGVMLSHYALIVNLTQASNWGQVGPEDSYLCVLPFFHGFGMSIGLNTSLVHGARLELMPRWDVRQTIRHMASGKVTLFAGVPTMYVAILNHPDFKKLSGTKLRGCYVGAAPVPESLKEEFHRKTGGILIEGYGLTEAVTAKSANPMNGLKKEKSIGIPWPDTIFQIVDDEGRPLPPNEPGEIRMQSPDLMMGYWENPEATSECMRDGWLYTGDIGYMDSDGYFYIVDRKKDLIISGGYNVYPSEVEEVIYSHEDVLEASVIGIPDAKKGESVKAFVVTVSGSHLNETALTEYLAARLIKYKLPASIEFRESLPKSPIGKILKKELAREELDRLQNA